MIKNNLNKLVVMILICLVLFFAADVASELLASFIIYFKAGFFEFSWKDVSVSFFTTGYVGGIVLGIGIWLKSLWQTRKERKLVVTISLV